MTGFLDIASYTILLILPPLVAFILNRLSYASFNYEPVLIGGGLLMLTLIIQPPVQVALGRGVSNLAAKALIAGLIAGLIQEGLKLIAIVKLYSGSIRQGFYIGFGFGLAEWGLTLVFTGIVLVLGLQSIDPLIGFFGAIERISSIIFHTASATLLACFVALRQVWKGYILISLFHGAIDWMAAYLHVMSALNNYLAIGLMEAFWLAASVVLLFIGLRGVKIAEEQAC